MNFNDWSKKKERSSAIGWQSVRDAKPDGTICKIKLADTLGTYDSPGEHFLHDDGFWYCIDPPAKIIARVYSFKPVGDRVENRLTVVNPAKRMKAIKY